MGGFQLEDKMTTRRFLLHNRKRRRRRRRLNETCLLMVMAASSQLVQEGLAASPSSRYHHHHNNKLMNKPPTSSYSISQQRGGSSSNKKEDEELDAYIEDLISTIEATDEENIVIGSTPGGTSNHHHDNKNTEEEDAVEYEEAEEIDSSEMKVPTIESPVEEQSTEKQPVGDDAGEEGPQKQREKRKKKRKPSLKSTVEVKEEALGESDEETARATSSPKLSSKQHNNSPAKKPLPEPMDTRRRRQHPPNALYRFLLHQGAIGHVLVMFLILCVEWLYAYLPSLAHLLAWIWTRVFGRPYVVSESYYDGHDKGEPFVKATQTSVAAVRSRRTGQTGKQRRALTRQADEASLVQLKRIGNVQQAKYRYVSLDFMQRHGLGPFAGERQDVVYSLQEAKEEASVGDSKMELKKRTDKKTKSVARYDEQEDVDWVIQALSSNLPKPTSGKPATVSVGVGSDGVSVGVEFSVGRRQAVLDAVTSERKRKISRTGPRASDKDGGDGIFGRLRAATGVNSLVSRSLLGAYPGDAVPPDEAASVQGVTELAQKYGWGDWSDEDDDESQISVSKRRKRRKKRRVETPRSPTIGVEITLSSGKTRPPTFSRRKDSSRASTRTEEPQTTPAPLSARRRMKEIDVNDKRRKVRRRKTVRPALERISEVKNNMNEDGLS